MAARPKPEYEEIAQELKAMHVNDLYTVQPPMPPKNLHCMVRARWRELGGRRFRFFRDNDRTFIVRVE